MSAEPRISGHALARLLPDMETVAGLKYGVLNGAIRSLILDGRIAIGTRLPSERELAGVVNLSRATVTAGYDGLREAGYLTSRSGSGSFVTLPAGPFKREVVREWPRAWDESETIDLTLAAMPAPPGTIVAALSAASAEFPAHAYGGSGYDAFGLPALRAAVADRFEARGVPTDPTEILITNGALHGLDLLLRLAVGAGDRVLTELPSYPGALDAIRASAGGLLPVPLAPGGGWDLGQMEAVLRQSSPKLAYLIPDFHNPTGVLVDDEAREVVFAVARQTSTIVVVDETFLGLGFVPAAAAAAAIDPAVITIGSLSKSVWGGLRIGWIRAPADLIQRLAALRASIDLGSPVLDQLVAVELMGQLDTIFATRVEELTRKRDALQGQLADSLPEWKAAEPDGGISLWVDLGAPVSTALTLLARSAGVLIVPGSRFGVDGTFERYLRLPYALAPERLADAVRRLAAVWGGLDRGGGDTRQLVVA
jgi:DNA-binding transcriptional MocR family regulator